MKMYCITIYNDHYEKINRLGYIPVGLGKKFSQQNLKLIKMVKIFLIKIHIMGNIVFIIGCGKMS